jgi:hypothetical protein
MYCAWDTGGHWIRQDFEPVRSYFAAFYARQPVQPGLLTLDLLYTDSTVRQVVYHPGDAWTGCQPDTLFNPRKWLCGIRFWGRPGGSAADSTYLDDVVVCRSTAGDIGVAKIVSPSGDSFRVGRRIIPAAYVKNYGSVPMTSWVWAHFAHESLPDEYWDSTWVTLRGRESLFVQFRDWIPQVAGWYHFFIATDPLCSTYLRLLVLDSSGIAEFRRPGPARLSAGPTIGSSFLPRFTACRSRVTVRDASGATVWQGPAADRVALSPGVYFIEAEERRTRVILVR